MARTKGDPVPEEASLEELAKKARKALSRHLMDRRRGKAGILTGGDSAKAEAWVSEEAAAAGALQAVGEDEDSDKDPGHRVNRGDLKRYYRDFSPFRRVHMENVEAHM